MLNINRLRNLLNPLNAVITSVIILFILFRVLLNNHENVFVIETISATEAQTSTQSNIQIDKVTEEVLETSSEELIKIASNTPLENQLATQTSELLAYSAELDKTFSLDAFNELSKEELMTFNGIGEVTAQAILDYRRDNGPFGHFDDLMLVKGIGEKKLKKIMMILP